MWSKWHQGYTHTYTHTTNPPTNPPKHNEKNAVQKSTTFSRCPEVMLFLIKDKNIIKTREVCKWVDRFGVSEHGNGKGYAPFLIFCLFIFYIFNEN